MLRKNYALIIGVSLLAACGGQNSQEESLENASSAKYSVQLSSAQNDGVLNRLTILANGNTTVLKPEDFKGTILTTDIENNTDDIIEQDVKGTKFLAAAVNVNTGKVAVAIEAFLYAESSYDILVVLDANNPQVRRQLPIGGSKSLQPKKSFNDIKAVKYDSAGRLIVTLDFQDMSGAELVYNPDLSLVRCTPAGGGENLCPSEPAASILLAACSTENHRPTISEGNSSVIEQNESQFVIHASKSQYFGYRLRITGSKYVALHESTTTTYTGGMAFEPQTLAGGDELYIGGKSNPADALPGSLEIVSTGEGSSTMPEYRVLKAVQINKDDTISLKLSKLNGDAEGDMTLKGCKVDRAAFALFVVQ